MKIRNFIKLVSFVTMLSLLPFHASFAGCGCGGEGGEGKTVEDKARTSNNETGE